MKSEREFNNNNNLKEYFNSYKPSEFICLTSRPNPNTKIDKFGSFFSQKSSLELILSLVKNNQLEYFSANNRKNKIKKILSSFKDNLNSLQKKKNKEYSLLRAENENIKNELQKQIFKDTEKYEEEKNKEKGNSYCNETEQLKNLNFGIENEIKNIDFLINQKNKMNSNIKLTSLNKEIFYNHKNHKNVSEISDILNNDINQIKKTHNNALNEQEKKKREINFLLNKIELKKEAIDDKFNNSIVQEEFIEYTQSTFVTVYNKNKSGKFKNYSEKTQITNNNILIKNDNFKSCTIAPIIRDNKYFENNLNSHCNIFKNSSDNTDKEVNVNNFEPKDNLNIDYYKNEKDKKDDDDDDKKSFNSSQCTESLEEELELEHEEDFKYNIRKITSPKCLSYDNTENSKNPSDNEDEPNEFILDINEDADYMFSNIPEKEANF
jgi:hypothetical protein